MTIWTDPPAPAPHAADWAAFKAAIAPVETIDEQSLVRQKSRDFYWYSPILKRQLNKHFGDLLVLPKDEAEVIKVAAACARMRIPLTVRGAGTGNYGQAMPLAGGVILDMTKMDKIVSLEGGALRVQPGLKLIDLEAETIPQGWELRFHPSTRRTATIGGFIAGGSGGIGSIGYGTLRDRGTVRALRVVTVEENPRTIVLEGDDVQKVVHAYGTNGIVTELDIAMARTWPWAECIASFKNLMDAVRFAQAVGESDGLIKKELAVVDWGAARYFKPLMGHLREGEAIVIVVLADAGLEALRDLAGDHNGSCVFERMGAEGDETIPPLYEFTWNHTTLQALKVDKTVTYLQTLFPPPDHVALVEKMWKAFGDEVVIHLEFARMSGRVGCFGLQVVRYTTPERLKEIIDFHNANGCPIFDPHTFLLEDGGMRVVDEAQYEFKRAADPHGLLNPFKMRAWEERTPTGGKWAEVRF
ncbi:MAG: FAD-binding oxidoreductase [Rhodospirillales bacterium]|nr:FAD-binding oxidoreductase [Rhodospirillales bacterium]